MLISISHPSHPPFPDVHTFVLYVSVSISALQMGSSVQVMFILNIHSYTTQKEIIFLFSS